jgi:aminoglycoside 3-N-acetyltransferase
VTVGSAIRDAGLGDRCVCLHSSFRSFDGSISPDDLVDAFLAEGCTLVVPTFSWDAHAVRPPEGARGNGTVEEVLLQRPEVADPFTTDSVEVDVQNMGIVPATVVRRPGRVRGNHPLISLSAIGPRARELLEGQSPDTPFAPIDALCDAGGAVVLAGVGLTNMTLLHRAEQLAGRRLFPRWGMTVDGPTASRCGGCSLGFERLAPALEDVERRTTAAGSPWRIYDAALTLMTAADAIRANPEITRCDDPSCTRCPELIAGGPA